MFSLLEVDSVGDRVFTKLSSRKVEGSCGRGRAETNVEASDLGDNHESRRDAELDRDASRPLCTERQLFWKRVDGVSCRRGGGGGAAPSARSSVTSVLLFCLGQQRLPLCSLLKATHSLPVESDFLRETLARSSGSNYSFSRGDEKGKAEPQSTIEALNRKTDGRTSCFHRRRLNFTDSLRPSPLHGSITQQKEFRRR